MKLRIADRILVALAGLLLLAACAGIVAQMFFNVDLVGMAGRVFTSEKSNVRILLIALAVLLLLLGIYCVFVLFRHRRRKDKFILQKSEGGELAISVKALENMVQKCLDQHGELNIQNLYLENKKDGLLIRMRGNVAGGISIPLTVESLQKQIRQYVTACSGVEVKGIRVQIESSGPDAPEAPFAIASPAPKPLLHEAEKEQAPVQNGYTAAEPETPAAPQAAVPQPAAAPAEVPAVAEDEEDDRPLHQRLFSTQPEPCIVPEPPAEEKGEVKDETAEVKPEEEVPAETDETAERKEEAAEAETEASGETAEADPSFLESLKAFDSAIAGDEGEEKKE